ncbi:S1/P1 Nuclease [Granulicella pectinivorans]|uniref:S1/P1 Nuclease n=1 Tax=Granulicella pectinivorans TaxID=474950 RepID=A0A1I6M200_9BACT|nr:S1/P1 nuclease [Granulicella pectinivorans]SFS09658.1 S1/P1 Nuclease [Granulicella pectinivorans]
MPTHLRAKLAAAALLPLLALQPAYGWGRDGHLMINRLAALYLPQDVPAFLRNGEAIDTIEYLGPEPDRWKNRAEEELSSTQSPDHFIDMEWADYAGALPKRRYDFIRALAAAQPAHPDIPLTPEKVGMQPYQVEEVYERLKSTLRDYRRLVAANQDTRPAEMAILFYAGWLGHYVADGSQPLHTTIQYNGWTGPNPNGYSTAHTIHAQFESIYVTANIKPADVAPLVAASRPKALNDEWADYLAYLRHTNSDVEKTYQLEKAGAFTGAGTAEGKAFTEERLAAGAIELRDLIYTAWLRSGDPVQEYKGPQ